MRGVDRVVAGAGGNMLGLQRFVLLPLVLVAPALPASGQSVRGFVVEAGPGTPLVGAEVELMAGPGTEATSLRATTDTLGKFVISPPEPGRYRLRVTHPGYRTYETDSVDVGSGEIVSVEVRMGANAIPLEPLVVTARSRSPMSDFERRRSTGGFGRFFTREDIEARNAPRTTELLRGVSGLTVAQARRGRTSMLLMRSGLGLCQPALWVDGHLVDQNRGSTIDDVLLPSTIEAVEVYRSSAEAPVQYVTGPCGVVLFWTRRGTSEGGQPWHWKRLLAGVGAAVGLIILFVH